MSKSKVAALQETSIPTLELLSAVLALGLAKKLVNGFQLSMDMETFWCHSMNVLWWIRGRSRKLKPFVANRVSEIQSVTNPMMWKHVPTKINSADLLSRETAVDVLASNDLWLYGPSFLQKLMNV